ncbi:probable ATP-dependent RNA helicase DDX47 [Trifolium pratense]|uniref:probable ATP-dependent RNA helicase DDX47 n=1 Tax=Trifolium pratense TaxID=57577 RepID=UPI001E694262|nr:probable ATP-dependent RNA helicase DDX47 [Trifolium pratense]
MKSFTDLGLSFELVEACEKNLVWYDPTKIQREMIPLALQGKDDVFAISPPRSGKVGDFVLPILHTLLETRPNLNTFFACVLSPTRHLGVQIAEYFFALGSQFGVNDGASRGGYLEQEDVRKIQGFRQRICEDKQVHSGHKIHDCDEVGDKDGVSYEDIEESELD